MCRQKFRSYFNEITMPNAYLNGTGKFIYITQQKKSTWKNVPLLRFFIKIKNKNQLNQKNVSKINFKLDIINVE